MDSFFSIFLIIADFITYRLLGLEEGLKLTESVHFFVYDVLKIIVLLIIIIYVIGLARSTLDMERVRAYIQGKNRFVGYLLASFFGAITPFCSCSSIPLFLGFTAARIPVGITMAFLITSPIINEVAIVLLGSILGIKFTLAYLAVGFIAGIIGGFFFDAIKAERFLTPLGQQSKRTIPLATMGGASPQPPPGLQMAGGSSCSSDKPKPITENSWAARHQFAKAETVQIVKQIWKWVILGIGIGALFHGYVPQDWVEKYLGGAEWWTVPIASVLGIPLYSGAAAIIPVAESMLAKGVPVGTMLAFMMSVVGASFPEFILLKQVMKTKMLILLFGLLLVLFTLTGWLFNSIAPALGL